MDRIELAQESARPVNLDHVLIVLAHLNDTACPVSLVRVRSRLVLYADKVPHLERWEAFGVLRPSASCADVAFAEGLLPCRQRLTPCYVRPVPPGWNRDEVADGPAEDTHRWG